jgi:hypothetical protein
MSLRSELIGETADKAVLALQDFADYIDEKLWDFMECLSRLSPPA